MTLEPGSVVGGRYRLQRAAWRSPAGDVWLAHDSVLERSVLLHTFASTSADAVSRTVAAAAHASHPGICQIYDITTDPVGIVAEHAPGGRLADRKDGALPPATAAAAVAHLAGAIEALHQHGIAHGAVGPESVLFDEEGRAKLTNPAVASSGGDAASLPEGYRPRDDDDAIARDRYGLAAVAYRLFTGREPGHDAPPARSVRRNLPPEVDALLARGLGHDAAARPSPGEFRRVLGPIAAAEPAADRGPGFFRQEARWLVPVLFLVGLGIAGTIVGVRLGAIKIGGGETSPSPSPSAEQFKVAAVEDFDPPPGNGEEHPEDAASTIDGRDTSWSTVGYARANLDGRKKGVGLLFDLGRARSVGRIEVRTSLISWQAEWRVADSKGTTADAYRIVERFTAGGEPIVLSPPTTARYWLLWITRLVDNGSGSNIPYQATVSEVRFYAR